MFQTNVNLQPWIHEILENVTPTTQDGQTLSLLTTRQIVDSSYVENELTGNAFDSNFLVPRNLYARKKNQVWRYPPLIYFEFLVKTQEVASLNLVIRYAIPRFIRYGERRFVSGPKRSSVTTINQITDPKVELPKDFGIVGIFGRTYNLTYDGAFKPKTVAPKLREHKIAVKIDPSKSGVNLEQLIDNLEEEKAIVKKYDAHSRTLVSPDDSEPHDIGVEPTAQCKPDETEIGFIQLVTGEARIKLIVETFKTETPDLVRVGITLVNNNPTSENPRKLEWTSRCIILPNIMTSIRDGEFLMPPQQHHDAIQFTLKNDENALPRLYDELSYVNTNGVLSKSTKNANTLIFSTFGVFDTIRELPVPGPNVNDLLQSNDSLLTHFDLLSDDEKKIIVNNGYLPLIKSVLQAAFKSFRVNKNIHKFQWDAIQNRIKIIANNQRGTTTIIKAPTGSGKTLVFMVNAALHSIITKERSVLVFPTRILNQDMFQRLTKFIYEMRKLLSDRNITGGIFIGISDPLYKALVNPVVGVKMVQFDSCPSCGITNSITTVEKEFRKIGRCSCGHEISYMYNPQEVPGYLPLITIATPDNLFYTSTCRNFGSEQGEIGEKFPMRFFGGYYVKCQCSYNVPIMDEKEKSLACTKCKANLQTSSPQTSPIGYFVFDEVHSLYGLTGILLSIYLKSLNVFANKITDWYLKEPLKYQITFETGTATIANEIDLLKYITRVTDGSIRVVPDTKDYEKYFSPNTNLVKYRTVITLPIAKASRTSTSHSILRTYSALYHDDTFKNLIKNQAGDAYDFILGYVYRKSDGYTIRKTIQELSGQSFGKEKQVEFLSGDATTTTVSRIFQMALNKETEILLANLVISLGLDIGNLNNMIMLGMPKSMTEFVQTAGRTGRLNKPGHVYIHLLPSVPRDNFVYENFHRVMSDVSGYYDKEPIQSTNAYAAKIIFPNILKLIINAFSYYGWLLSIPKINRALQQKEIYNSMLLDVLRCLRDEINAPEAINKEIAYQTKKQFDDFIGTWSKMGGPGLYLGRWFPSDGKALTTLRSRNSKEIQVHVNENSLLDKIGEHVKPQWVTYPEEELNESEEETEDE